MNQQVSDAGLDALRADAMLGRLVDGWVCMNTPFNGEPPYIGNDGIMLALRELAAERDALRADAERYRWLRWGRRELPDGGALLSPPDLDAAIDAAIKSISSPKS